MVSDQRSPGKAPNIEIKESILGGSPQKKSIFLKKQMSETRFQEYKRQQMQQQTEQLKNETADNFLSPQVQKARFNKNKILKVDKEGTLQKRSILGTTDLFHAVEKKPQNGTQVKKNSISHGSNMAQGIIMNRLQTLNTPLAKIMKSRRISGEHSSFSNHLQQQLQQQQKQVNFQSNPKTTGKPQVPITNQQIDALKKRIEDRIRENESKERELTSQQLPLGIQLRESKSQRIFEKYSSTQEYWDKQKSRFTQLAGKQIPEECLLHATDDYRKKVEVSELIDKTLLNVESLGQTLWKANLRNYQNLENFSGIKKGSLKTNQSTESAKKQALAHQQKLEEKVYSKTFLQLESLGQCVDITSVYLDKTFKPTEIIRTPNFDLAKYHQDISSSVINKGALDNPDQSQTVIQNNNSMQQTHPWWNETFKEEIIQEEQQEDELLVQQSSLGNQFSSTSISNQNYTQFRKSNINVSSSQKDFRIQSHTQLQRPPQTSSMMSSNYSSMSKRKRGVSQLLENTMTQIKQQHGHLISNTNEDDLNLLCIQGFNKLEMEAEAAKKMTGPKYLLDQDAIDGEDRDPEQKDKDEIIAFNYDQKYNNQELEMEIPQVLSSEQSEKRNFTVRIKIPLENAASTSQEAKKKPNHKKPIKSMSHSLLPQISNPSTKNQVISQPQFTTIPQKDLDFEFLGDYQSAHPVFGQKFSKDLSTGKIVQNLKSLNDYMDKKFTKGQKIKFLQNIQGSQQQKKTMREQYGEFYKNLIKPQGGRLIEQITGQDQRRASSQITIDGPLITKNKKLNPLDQMQTAKTSFINMINLINNTPGSDNEKQQKKLQKQIQQHIDDITILNQTTNSLDIGNQTQLMLQNDSKIINQEVSSIEDYRKKLIDNSANTSLKNITFEKPASVYHTYLKEQGQKSVENFQKTVSSINNQANYIKEKITFRNHLKIFTEDSQLMDQFNAHIENFEVPQTHTPKLNSSFQPKVNLQGITGGDKINMQLQTISEKKKDKSAQQPILLNCFKNLEHEFGRADIQTFERIIKDLISGHLNLEDLVPKSDLDKIMNEKFYAGFSMAPQVRETYKDALEDEYGLNIDELEKLLVDKKYYKNVNKQYKEYLKRYRDCVRELEKFKKVNKSDDYASIIEEFKKFKALRRPDIKVEDKILIENEGSFENQDNQQKSERYTAFILYMAIQEMIKQVFVECRDKGRLFWKLFRKYFEEQERNWFSIIQDLTEQIKVLKLDRSFLLNKFVNKKNQEMDKVFIKENLQKIIDNKEQTQENLINHKSLIMELIGFVNREEDERYLMEVEKRNLEKDVKDIIYQWELVRSNLEFKERINKVNTQKIKEDFNLMEEVRQMKRDDLAVLINLERIRMALSNGGSVQWDLEKIQLLGQNHFYKEENHVMKQEMKRLREQYDQAQEQLQELSKENFDLTQRLKKFTSHLEIIEKIQQEIQTDVSFKNEEFTTSLDQILKNKLDNKLKKISKLMNKAKANVNRYQPMSQQEMMDLIQGIYIKKSQEINTKNELNKEFDDFVYSVLIQRFGTKKKADQKGQEFLLALRKYAKEDERVEFFKKFLGFEETRPYSREVLEFFIMLMKATNESIQNIMSVAQEGQQSISEKVYIEFTAAFEKYCKVFNNSSQNLKEELKKHLIFDSELIIENQPKIEVKLNEKWELYAMLIFQKNAMSYSITSANIEQVVIEKFQIDEENSIDCAIPYEQFKQFFSDQVGTVDSGIVFSVIDREEFFKKYFGVLVYQTEGPNKIEMIKIRGLKKLFRERYEFKISVRKFLDLGMKMSIRFSEEAKEYYGKIFKVFDADGDGFISFKEFRKIIKKVDPQRSDWKIHAIYQKATGVDNSDKGQLRFEEFIKCAMNNVLMEQMIDWDKILMEEKTIEEEENKINLFSNLHQQPRNRVSTMRVKNSNRNLSIALSPQSGRSRKNSARMQ